MTDTPGYFAAAARDEDLFPLLRKLETSFQGIPLGFVQTVAGTALADLSRVIPVDSASATVQVQGGAIRYTFDGTVPTAAIGHRADVGTILTITTGAALRGFQWISEAAVNNSLAVTFWS